MQQLLRVLHAGTQLAAATPVDIHIVQHLPGGNQQILRTRELSYRDRARTAKVNLDGRRTGLATVRIGAEGVWERALANPLHGRGSRAVRVNDLAVAGVENGVGHKTRLARITGHQDVGHGALYVALATAIKTDIVEQRERDARVGGTPPANNTMPMYSWSKKSTVYHYSNCRFVSNIAPANLVQGNAPPEGKTLHQGCPK